MPYVDLSEFLTENELVLQGIGPRDYVVPAPPADVGLKYSALANIAVKVSKGEKVAPGSVQALRLDDDEEREFVSVILGDEALSQMKEDQVPWPAVTRSAQYAFAHFAVSAEAAQKALAAGAFSGKAPAPAQMTGTGVSAARPASTGSRSPKKTTNSRGRASSNRGA